MSPVTAVIVIVALVGAATALGVVWRARQGRVRVRPGAGTAPLDPAQFAVPGDGSVPQLGARATLVQFSTEFCASCPGTRRVLRAIGQRTEGVAYLDVDVTHRADLVRRFALLQTPTTLVLDGRGVVRSRIGGAVRPAAIEAALEEFA